MAVVYHYSDSRDAATAEALLGGTTATSPSMATLRTMA